MRKVTYYIDDVEFLRQKYSVPEEIIKDIEKRFIATLTFIGDGMFPDKYVLIDGNGNPISISSLNGYEMGCIYNDCYSHFSGMQNYSISKTEPWGVLKIEETIL